MGRNRFDFANLFASFLHLSWGIIFSCLWAFKKKSDGGHRDLVYPLYSSYSSWNATEIELVTSDALKSCAAPRSLHFGDMTVSPAWNDAEISLSLHWLVTSFFFLSAFFQFLAVMIPRSLVPNAVIRFVEYSISASIMIVAIGLQLGIFHAQVLLLLAALTWTTMICGIVAEMLLPEMLLPEMLLPNKYTEALFLRGQLQTNVDTKTIQHFHTEIDSIRMFLRRALRRANRVAWLAHAIGWVTQMSVFFVLLQQFHGGQNCSPRAAPAFVWAIVYGELALFSSFGFVQLLQLSRSISAKKAEMIYTVLSFVSKTLLGWLVYAGNFVD
jgi:hypothetical protein